MRYFETMKEPTDEQKAEVKYVSTLPGVTDGWIVVVEGNPPAWTDALDEIILPYEDASHCPLCGKRMRGGG